MQVAGEPLEEAKIAVRRPKRLHRLSVFADYRKAVNIDGFSALVVTAQGDGVRFHVSAGKERGTAWQRSFAGLSLTWFYKSLMANRLRLPAGPVDHAIGTAKAQGWVAGVRTIF
jgi:hypothetical protein